LPVQGDFSVLGGDHMYELSTQQRDQLLDLVKKLKAVESDVSNDRGEFELFALDSIDVGENRWRLLASTKSADAILSETADTISSRLEPKLVAHEKFMLAEIISLPSADPLVVDCRRKWGKNVPDRGMFVTDRSPDDGGIDHMMFLVRCQPMP
jgi:hypothetical protein